MSPEKEKEGLLLPGRSREDDAATRDEPLGRRPADVWLPRWGGCCAGRAEAIDFAAASGIRPDKVGAACTSPNNLCTDYKEYKRNYRGTEAECTRQGFVFTPFVVEAHGGSWSPTARRLTDHISQQQAAAGLWARESLSMKVAQRISCVIQTQNAKAILRRIYQAPLKVTVEDLDTQGEFDLSESEDDSGY